MTLCKYRPQRTYPAQLIIDSWEMGHLVDTLNERARELAAGGEAASLLFDGASMALSTLASLAADANCEYRMDFMREFERDAGTLEEEC